MTITKLMEGLPNQSMSQADFDQATGKYMGDLPAWGAEVNATKDDMNALASSAAGSASTASTKAGEAAGSASAALSSKNSADVSATTAHASELAASASAVASAASASSLTATSVTDLVIATGPLIFATQTGKQFPVGANMEAVDQANSANAVYGKVAAYSGTSLTINVTGYEGSGLVSDWNIAVVGQRGQQGATGGVAGGNLTGAVNESKGADIASTATLDVWSGAGNYEVVTGTVATTGFTAAPQAGASRRLLAAGAWPLTAGANALIKGVLNGQTFTCAAGDEIEVYAETTTKFRITVFRNDGIPTADGGYMQVQDQKTSGTPGGAGTGGAENIRTLNTAATNTIAGASLSANRITLAAGSYEVALRVPGNNVSAHRARLWNVTDSTPALVGQNCSSGGATTTYSEVFGRLVLAASKQFEVRHYIAGSSGTSDFGPAMSQSGIPEIFTSIEIKKVA